MCGCVYFAHVWEEIDLITLEDIMKEEGMDVERMGDLIRIRLPGSIVANVSRNGAVILRGFSSKEEASSFLKKLREGLGI